MDSLDTATLYVERDPRSGRTNARGIINMLRNAITASAALALTAAPIAAQAAPAARSAAPVAESEELVGTTMWIVAAIALGLIVWGVIELTSDDEPESP